VRGAARSSANRHPAWLGAFESKELASVLGDGAADTHAEWRSAYSSAPTRNDVERLVYTYAKTYLQDDILVKVDRASMANSLEVRAPFLDVELVAFLSRVPARLKLRRFETKHLLKRAMADVLPPGIAGRRKKGFGIPIAEWFKGPLRQPLQDELSPARLRDQGIFEPSAVQKLLDEHGRGRRDHRKQLWTLLMFQLWHRRWAAGGRSVPPNEIAVDSANP
jgi:asparagine synthase (glutamine-hydrolysing)